MRDSMADILRCPRCHGDRTLGLTATARDEREVREGALTCRRCGTSFPVQEGIVDLLDRPPDFVRREAAGLERFAESMRNDGWDRERVRALPESELGYWIAQGTAMRWLLEAVELQPGRRIVDVGSNTCWASNIFARRGLEVVALDIAKAELQGLRTAEYFLQDGDVYFERLLSVMFDPALASESMDYVFCCEVLHHNDAANLQRTMRELYRVLRPGGTLIVLNEPLRFPLNLKRDHGEEVAEFEGYEHVYFFHQYYLAARRAGFRVAVQEPPTEGLFGNWTGMLEPDTTTPKAVRLLGVHALRRRPLGRRALLAYKTLLTGDVGLTMIATKPGTLGPPLSAAVGATRPVRT